MLLGTNLRNINIGTKSFWHFFVDYDEYRLFHLPLEACSKPDAGFWARHFDGDDVSLRNGEQPLTVSWVLFHATLGMLDEDAFQLVGDKV